MQTELLYKGYLIKAASQKLVESGKWTTSIHIMKDYGSHITDKPFSASNQWISEKEAIDHCFDFGMQIVDGKYPDMKLL
jgi:hypothetical protein